MADHLRFDPKPRHMHYGFREPLTYAQAMPKLIADGNVPLVVPGVMDERLAAYHMRQNDPDLHNNWSGNYLDTASGRVSLDGVTIIGHPMRPLLEVTPKSELRNHGLPISTDVYRLLPGTRLTRKQLEDAGINTQLRKKDVLDHCGWLALAENPDRLLRYATMVYDATGLDEAMGLYINLDEQLIVRSWFLNRIGGRYGSYASGGRLLDGAIAQLVGVRRAEARVENRGFSDSPSPSSASEAGRAKAPLEELLGDLSPDGCFGSGWL